MRDTKTKILSSAERLFAERGYEATSLRQIIAAAKVNLAAVHYHFGSKADLLDHLVHRKVEPVNRERLARLDRMEAGGRPLTVEEILRAFFLPTAEVASANPQFVRVMGRIYSEGLMPGIVQKHFQPTAARFLDALRRAVPDLPEAEFRWRVHFMMGAMAHTMCGTPLLPGAGENFHERMQKLVTFLSAGFRAPVCNGEVK
jgi:AcrR family transcriptional regulator